MLRDQEHLADYRCDSGNRLDVQCYHIVVSQHSPRGRPNNTGNGIGGLVVIVHVSIDKTHILKMGLTCHMITT